MQEEVADDSTIPDEAELWRRIHPAWVVSDSQGGQRPSSQAFQNLEGENLSVILDQIVREGGRTPQDLLALFPGYSLVAIQAGAARQLDQKVVRAPEPDEPAHCHLVGQKNKRVQKALSKAAVWVVSPI